MLLFALGVSGASLGLSLSPIHHSTSWTDPPSVDQSSLVLCRDGAEGYKDVVILDSC